MTSLEAINKLKEKREALINKISSHISDNKRPNPINLEKAFMSDTFGFNYRSSICYFLNHNVDDSVKINYRGSYARLIKSFDKLLKINDEKFKYMISIYRERYWSKKGGRKRITQKQNKYKIFKEEFDLVSQKFFTRINTVLQNANIVPTEKITYSIASQMISQDTTKTKWALHIFLKRIKSRTGENSTYSNSGFEYLKKIKELLKLKNNKFEKDVLKIYYSTRTSKADRTIKMTYGNQISKEEKKLKCLESKEIISKALEVFRDKEELAFKLAKNLEISLSSALYFLNHNADKSTVAREYNRHYEYLIALEELLKDNK